MYIKRLIDKELINWKQSDKRKPILLRGARQVGKTKAVQELGKQFSNYVEINFDSDREIHSVFASDLSPEKICENISAIKNVPIQPNKTLLFFDEIQACVPAIQSIRYFYEKMPELHLIAAGSLLEFVLEELPSFGVGRIRSMYMYPLSFTEFLVGCGEEILASKLKDASASNPLHPTLHNKFLELFNKFLVLGGMPEVLAKYIENHDIIECTHILDDIIYSFNDDFAKYKKRVPVSRLREVFESVVNQAGGKFVYSNAIPNANHAQIKEALQLLNMAGLVHSVKHTSANGLPLGAGVNPKMQKFLLFDTGIFQRLLKLDIAKAILSKDFNVINKGSIAELYVGLELIKSQSCYQPSELFYWHRESKNGNAEVDYVIQRETEIIPVEVKAGTKGSMQSMYLFMQEKNKNKGIRISTENFATYNNIDVYPLYATAQLFST